MHDDPSAPSPSLPNANAAEIPAPARVAHADRPSLPHRTRLFVRRHGRKLWWLHSVYALVLGSCVVLFAQKGFEHARWLSVSVVLAWLLVVVFFRLFGSATQRNVDAAATGAKIRFFAMTYVLKNLYQGMLFFLLPFYWRSATLDAPNVVFALLLTACAILSTLDIVFDRVLFRVRFLASTFHALTLFSCLNLLIPAIAPNTRTLTTLLSAAGIAAIAFLTMHVRPRSLRDPRVAGVVVAAIAAAVGGAYVARAAIPPVPMHLAAAGVGPKALADGRLAMEVRSLHTSAVTELLAVTDVVVPGGKGDRLRHVWRQEGRAVHRSTEDIAPVVAAAGTIRLRSQLEGAELPAHLAGRWSVDVETDDGQLVGRTEFVVVE